MNSFFAKTLGQNSLILASFIVVLLASFSSSADPSLEYSSLEHSNCDPMLEFETNKLHSNKTVNFCEKFNDKVLLVVNTASHCGFTPQFKQLEKLYQKYKDQGLEIVGFPSNDFNQESKSEEQTASVCFINFGVTFNMVSTSSVTGEKKNEFFKSLTQKTGIEPSWNFNKYLISKDKKTIQHFQSSVQPISSSLENKIIELLKIEI